MEPELFLRLAAIVIASLLLFSNINLSNIMIKLKSLFKRNKVNVNNIEDKNSQMDFLKVLGLWYDLKNSCEKYGLKLAAEKLDEVFPLLNEDKA